MLVPRKTPASTPTSRRSICRSDLFLSSAPTGARASQFNNRAAHHVQLTTPHSQRPHHRPSKGRRQHLERLSVQRADRLLLSVPDSASARTRPPRHTATAASQSDSSNMGTDRTALGSGASSPVWALDRQNGAKLRRDFGYRLCWFAGLEHRDLCDAWSLARRSARFAVGEDHAIIAVRFDHTVAELLLVQPSVDTALGEEFVVGCRARRSFRCRWRR
jgi:hypothetical protein